MSAPQAEKKSSCLAIGGVGCLFMVILVVGGLGLLWWKAGPWIMEKWGQVQEDPDRVGAMVNLKLNTDIEILKVDDEKRIVTFKIKSTGEEITSTFASVARSRITNINGKTEIHGLQRVEPDPTAAAPAPPSTSSSVPAPTPSAISTPKQE